MRERHSEGLSEDKRERRPHGLLQTLLTGMFINYQNTRIYN